MNDTRLQLDRFIPYRLSVASNAVSKAIAKSYEAKFGLKVAEWRLIAVLAEEGALTQQHLVARTEMDKVTVSRAAAQIVERKLANRLPNHDDKRSHSLDLTATGRLLYAEIVPLALRMEADPLEGLTKEEMANIQQMLMRFQEKAAQIEERY